MKNIVKAAGISLVIGCSFFANAAEAAQKVGYIGTAYIVKNMPQREAIMSKLQGELKDDRAELEKISADINLKAQKIERDGALLGAEGVQKLKIEISSLQAEGKIKQDAYQQKAQALEFQARNETLALIQKAVEKIAKKEGFDMVIDAQSLQYANPDLNLTDKVLAELK
ncbi:chaperone protein Skp [Vibrio sp. MACH09]|uniref:OmpH family outer membrane protein n=1 Tax=Vibrio sp. MACH09 TaxID=3025122 RepID=UPI002792F364|nr:OmpH family outer membrane protein [Vibrio sp. MACH09]GLO60178.1 chaperone protein Skp [Vibrio sp. MACH09]